MKTLDLFLIALVLFWLAAALWRRRKHPADAPSCAGGCAACPFTCASRIPESGEDGS